MLVFILSQDGRLPQVVWCTAPAQLYTTISFSGLPLSPSMSPSTKVESLARMEVRIAALMIRAKTTQSRCMRNSHHLPFAAICCDYTSPGCKVQTIHMAGRVSFLQRHGSFPTFKPRHFAFAAILRPSQQPVSQASCATECFSFARSSNFAAPPSFPPTVPVL